jgi:hypothetical protein
VRGHRTILVVIGVVALIAAHAIILQGLSTRIALPAAAVAIVVAVVVVKHVALGVGIARRRRRDG